MWLAVVHRETSAQWGRYTDRLVPNGTGTQWEIDWYTMGLVRRQSGTEWDWHTKRLAHSGTGTQRDWYRDWYTERLVLSGTGTQRDSYTRGLVYIDWYSVGPSYRLVYDGTNTQLDLYAMGLVHRETGIPWDCYIKRLTHNAHAQYTEGLVYHGTAT